MDNKDFFDEEFDKVEEQNKRSQNNADPFNTWNYEPRQNATTTKTSHKKAWFISLTCLAIVLCFVAGWVLCYVFGGTQTASNGESYYLGILQQVMHAIDNDLYVTDMSKYVDANGNWDQSAYNAAVAAAGTAMLQSLGDRFSRLMSPEQYFAYTYGGTTVSQIPSVYPGRFGVSFSEISGVGILVSAVSTDEASYGRLFEDDLVFKLSGIVGTEVDVAGNTTALGEVVRTDGEGNKYVALGDIGKDEISDILQWVQSATFHVLRDGNEVAVEVKRGQPSASESETINYVNYYFGADNTNLSTTVADLSPVQNGVRLYSYTSGKSTHELLGLASLDSFNASHPNNKVGYIALTEFSGDATANVDEQFVAALQRFKASGCKKLVLDLKGNPGGNVVYAVNIAGRLTYNFANLKGVTDKNGEYKITTLVNNKNKSIPYYCNTNYSDYYANFTATHYGDFFNAESGKNKCNIAVWTDGNSASASELVTGALKDYGAAVQMGTCTYGKGIAQTIETLNRYKQTFSVNGTSVTMPWAVYFTVDKYYTPADSNFTNNLHGKGLTPGAEFNNLVTYGELWTAACNYWN